MKMSSNSGCVLSVRGGLITGYQQNACIRNFTKGMKLNNCNVFCNGVFSSLKCTNEKIKRRIQLIPETIA